jgi:2-iminobutanoate/2-iminopropanoate deaminase
MSKINIINSDNAPKAVGPYSQAINFNNLIFTSGQIPIDKKRNNIIPDAFKDQVNQVLYNLNEVLLSAGSNKKDILKITVYLTNLNDFNELNQAFEDFFIDNFPARSVVEVSALPLNVKVEIDAICIK